MNNPELERLVEELRRALNRLAAHDVEHALQAGESREPDGWCVEIRFRPKEEWSPLYGTLVATEEEAHERIRRKQRHSNKYEYRPRPFYFGARPPVESPDAVHVTFYDPVLDCCHLIATEVGSDERFDFEEGVVYEIRALTRMEPGEDE